MKDKPCQKRQSAPTIRANPPGRLNSLLCAAIVGLCLMLPAPAIGGAENAVDGPPVFSAEKTWDLDLFAPGHVYDPYIAEPGRPGFSMTRISIMDSDIPDTGKRRYNFMLGGQYGLLKIRNSAFPDMAVQIDIYAAFLGQFDIDNSTDNIGWDGYYGVMVGWTDGHGLALKLAMQHDSSHVGDEYAERTGRRRVNYTREDIAFGVSYRFPEYFRVYTEAGYGNDLRNTDLQKPWRMKGGLEFENKDRYLDGRLGYYAALDLTFMEESDWDADITVQAGFVMPVGRFSQTVRIGPIYRNGRSLLGEFFQNKEEWWGLGVWIDL